MKPSRRCIVGVVVALGAVAVLTVAMIPLRSHLSIASDGLVLIVPVVAGAALGGFAAGVVSVVAGSIAYVLVFIPPYYTPFVGPAQNWMAPSVYLVVMLLVSRVVASKDEARLEARRQKEEISKLFGLSKVLVDDRPLDELVEVVVANLREALSLRTVAILPADGSTLPMTATAGTPLHPCEQQMAASRPQGEGSEPLCLLRTGSGSLMTITLRADRHPIGLLVLVGEQLDERDEHSILTFANQTAIALERARFREEAMRARLLEEVDRLAKTLVSAASHDLRTPLASIKTVASTLCDPELRLPPERQHELAQLIDGQADRLARLVTNLLDFSRIQAGVLELRRELIALGDLVRESVRGLGSAVDPTRIELCVPDELPLVDVDRLLIEQVVCNLVENAARHAPAGSPIVIAAEEHAERGEVAVSVTDRGAGVPSAEQGALFGMFNRRSSDGGSGLGLSIAKAFVEAHRGTIWVESAPLGGAKFCFTVSTRLPGGERLLVGGTRSHR